ncbi:protein-L-isoaspartate O-methyltransferase [Cocleimonas sp. KMM 6892]|uniref:protein-L-isoaspartate O-methyltransferase family protein n=1 Tax=unclassified Cocleimonas TaxID=2639732 RepID=UPI002DBE015C|nr:MULTISPECIES: protein-L-isoaspartate O-methyltransferase [unclassified Cocleimonas]MEB8431545.1 protein-L-isoaspartate O-methyltransferase [Cocleimonas sp. KMM 6892]MEC4713683.1 protein-L-isoaspartate O-methyltransferase [Cocleimonas sp. KMM 6895]MEC4743014.1 protein-L-isoaspartate O-methyltransferase [Cocleimonas sp. KMM 6896]
MDMEQARFNMIEQQIRTWEVLDDTVLQTMGSVPREIFVPESLKSLAYADIEVPLGNDEAMMFPRVEGRMLQELEINIDDNCLEIGTGSGYVTACMANMSNHVHSIDIYEEFLLSAEKNLAEVNVANVELEQKDAFSDWEAGRKYDVIAITGSIPEYLPMFENLLEPEGRLFVVVGSKQVAHAMKIVKMDDDFIRSSLFETELKPLVGKEAKPTFHF